MTKVQTYLRIRDEFVPIDQFRGILPDTFYIEGAIVLSLNGREIFQLKHYDLVDQLWAYIVDGLHAILEGKDYDVFFRINHYDYDCR